MKKFYSLILCLILITLCACANDTDNTTKGETIMYEQITPTQAKSIMDSEKDYIILDVREQDEFDAGHISGAILIPYTEIENKVSEIIPDKDKLILVYCRSGRRSKIAAESLYQLFAYSCFYLIVDNRNFQ